MNVLIIDDEYYARKAIIKLLENAFSQQNISANIFEFSNAEETITFLREQGPVVDAAFTDIRMDHVDGLELCRFLRQYNSQVSLVIISGYADFSYAQSAINSQVLAYLTKPVDTEEIHSVITKIIGLHDSSKTASPPPDRQPPDRQPTDRQPPARQSPDRQPPARQSPDRQPPDLAPTDTSPIHPFHQRLITGYLAEKNRPDNLAEKVLKYMEDNYSQDIRLENIAENVFFVHPNYLSKVLKKQFGKGFSKLLLDIRMNHALKYLQRGDLSVSAVARFVGYNSESHFVQTFKKFYGYTPSAARK